MENMIDKELLKNASGYADLTAYKAMQNVMKEDKTMQCMKNDIWEVETSRGDRKLVLIMAVGDECFLAYTLFDKPFRCGTAVMTKEGEKYIHPLRLVNMSPSSLVQICQTITDDEEEKIWDGLREAIGIDDDIQKPQKTMETESVRVDTDLKIQLEGERREKEIYKRLYEGLINKIVK